MRSILHMTQPSSLACDPPHPPPTRYYYNDASATWALLGKFEANNNSFEERLIDLKPHFNAAAALVTRRLKLVPTESHGVLPKMRIAM